MNDILRYLMEPANWFNWAFAIQALVVLVIGWGLLIALPDRISNRLTANGNLGIAMVVVGGGIILISLIPSFVNDEWLVVAGLVIGAAFISYAATGYIRRHYAKIVEEKS